MILDWIKKNRAILIPVGIIAVILLALWIWNISTKPSKDIDFSFDTGGNLPDLLNSVQGRYTNPGIEDRGVGVYLDVPMSTIIKNKSGKDVNLQNISGSLSYEGEPIFQTKADSQELKDVNVQAKSQKPVTDTFQVLVNGKTIKFIKNLIAGEKPKIDYMLNANILGVPYLFKNSTVLNQGK